MITNKSIGYTGRLCNQIFQHAVLISVGLKKGYKVKLPINNETVKPDGCFDLTNQKWLSYKLDLYNCFDLATEKCSDQKVAELKYKYNESGFKFDQNVFDVEDSTSIEGYYQSSKYFDGVREDILKEFRFKPAIEKEANDVINQINDKEIVSIHVRRQDYIASPTLELVGLEYIGKALEKFQDKDCNFLIVSDDIKWCKEVIQSDNNVFFSEGHHYYVDLCLLTKCQHSIIGNSTFAWWGAWANSNPNKKVIAPSKWFKPHTGIDASDLYCNGWIVI